MRAARVLAPGLALGAALAGCAAPEPPLYHERMLAMATWVDVTLAAPDPHSAAAAFAEVEALLHRAERDLYAWNPDGELARANAAFARGEPVELSPSLAVLLQRAQQFYSQSRGLFDPGVGALVELWGFHSMASPPSAPPSANAIEALLAQKASIGALDIDQRSASSRSRSLVLDLGGIAKGFVVDEALDLLAARGIHDALIDAGGDLRAIGRHGDRPWRVGVKDPRRPGVLVSIELADGEAAFTSGDYERYFEVGGKRYHHLLDPRTGRPAEHTASVTVIAADGTTADAAATALFVAGAEHWRETAVALNVALALRVDATGKIETTPAMAARLNSAARARSDIIPPTQDE